MRNLETLLDHNRQWAERIQQDIPELLERMSEGQQPNYLWIGCSDSRVPPNVISGMQPGELFVHRNIANAVSATDLNVQSVIQYAVRQLQVEHVIVCGHYGCGGVKAAMEAGDYGLMDQWLENIRDVHRQHRDELEALSSGEERYHRYCELNVVEQVHNVARSPFLRQAWKEGQNVNVHGLIFRLESGRLKNLEVTISGQQVT